MLETKNSAGTLLPKPADGASKRIAQYDLRRVIGRGAMTVVYAARDTQTGQEVALKVLALPASLTAGEASNLAARFERGARTVARLSHPKVVSVHEIGVFNDQHFLAMEYLHGQTLRERMNKGVTPREACAILTQIAEALDAVHAAGIVHGDLKPSNLMLLPDGAVKLLDFGLAQSSEDAAVTDAGIIVGAPSCMAPEQVKSQPGTPATDIWALGVLGYEMLTGYLPFTGQTVGSVLYRIVHQLPAPTPSLPAGVQKVLLRALDKLPIQRYSTAAAFVQALQAALFEPAAAAPEPAAPKVVAPEPVQPAPAKPAPAKLEAEAHQPAAHKLGTSASPRVKPLAVSALPIRRWPVGVALTLLFLLGFGGAFFERHQTVHAVQKVAAPQNFVPKTASLPTVQPPPTVQAPPMAVLPPPHSVALPFGPLDVQIKPRRLPAAPVPTARVTAEALPLRPAAPVQPVKQNPVIQPPVIQPPVMPRSVPVAQAPAPPARRPRSAPVVKQVAAAPSPAQTAARPVPVQNAERPAATVKTAIRPAAVPNAQPPVPVREADHTVPAQSAAQEVTLPAGEDGYDPEAAARLRKSAWSHEASSAP